MPWLIANPPGVCGRESEKQAQGNPETAVVEQKIPAVEDSITASKARYLRLAVLDYEKAWIPGLRPA